MSLPGCWVDIQKEAKECPASESFDVNPSPHPFISDCINYKACLFVYFIIFFVRLGLVCDKRWAVEHWDLVQGLWMTWGMHCVALYLASISSPPSLLLRMVWFQFVSVCTYVSEQRVRHTPSPPKISLFPPPLLPYFPNDPACLVKTLAWLLSTL